MASVRAQVLYFDGCPNHEALLYRLCEVMAELGVEAPIELTRVESQAQAERMRFLGSPTLRVNGDDVDPSASDRADYGLKCRLYASTNGLSGNVPEPLIRTALARWITP